MQFNAKNTFSMFLRRDEAELRNTSDTTKTSEYKTEKRNRRSRNFFWRITFKNLLEKLSRKLTFLLRNIFTINLKKHFNGNCFPFNKKT